MVRNKLYTKDQAFISPNPFYVDGVIEITSDPVDFAEWLTQMFQAWDLCGSKQEP